MSFSCCHVLCTGNECASVCVCVWGLCIIYVQTYVKALCTPQITQIGLVQLECVCLVLVAVRCLVFGVRWASLLVELFGRYAAVLKCFKEQ